MLSNEDLFNLQQPQPNPEQGGLLIAEPFLTEPYFRHSCICLVDYTDDEHHSTGLVLNNRINGITLNEVLSTKIFTEEKIPLFCGGPVALDHLLFLHDLGNLIPKSQKVGYGIYLNGKFESILEYVNSGCQLEGHLKFFLGYSGWDGGQLNSELGNHVWAVCNSITHSAYLSTEMTDFWRNCVNGLGPTYQKWLLCPENPSEN